MNLYSQFLEGSKIPQFQRCHASGGSYMVLNYMSYMGIKMTYMGLKVTYMALKQGIWDLN